MTDCATHCPSGKPLRNVAAFVWVLARDVAGLHYSIINETRISFLPLIAGNANTKMRLIFQEWFVGQLYLRKAVVRIYTYPTVSSVAFHHPWYTELDKLK